jgi:hypothetical protein
MGTRYSCSESDVKISKDNLAALEEQLGKSIFALAGEQEYTVYVHGDENGVENISFGESKWYESSFFEEISPFVKDGSFVEITDDNDGNLFRLMYQGGKVYHVPPKWEIDPSQEPI